MTEQTWEDRCAEYTDKVKVAVEAGSPGLLGERLSIHTDLMVGGHHCCFDSYVLAITELFIEVISALRYEPIDETAWRMVKTFMEGWPGKNELQEYHVICDASNNPCTLVDTCSICTTFGLRLRGMFAQFSLTARSEGI